MIRTTLEKEPYVSVIINCHNGERYLKECIQSVIKQTYQNWEIIFWDNCSTDCSSIIFKEFRDIRLKYFLSSQFTTLGEARNQAIANASGQLLAFIDCDDIWLPTKLEKQIALFDIDSVGIVISDCLYVDESGTNNVSRKFKQTSPSQGKVFEKLLQANFISQPTAIIRKSALYKLDKWFDSDFNLIDEYDLFIRLSYYYELAVCNEVLAKQRIHKNSLTWRQVDRIPSEKKLFLKKLSQMIPSLEVTYRQELKAIRTQILIQESLLIWESEGGDMARKAIRQIIPESRKASLIYILSILFPYRLFNYLNRRRIGLR